MTNRDLQLLDEIVDTCIPKSVPEYMKEVFGEKIREIEHPLDETIKGKLNNIRAKMRNEDDDYRIFYFADEI